MAKVKFGAIAADARASLDGITYSKNRFGAYTRKRTAPVNTRSAVQLAVRSTFGAIMQEWRALTDPQRAAWVAWSDVVPTLTDSLGNAYRPTGPNQFLAINQTSRTYGQTAILPDPPAFPGGEIAVNAFTLTLTADDATPEFSVETLSLTTDVAYFQVWASAPSSPGKSFFVGFGANGKLRGGDYRLIGTAESDQELPFNLTSAYVNVWGDIGDSAVGKKISVVLVPHSAGFIAGRPLRVDSFLAAL